MSMGRTSLNLTDERERWLERVKEKSGESTNSGAIDTALLNYLDTKRKAEDLVEELEEEYQEEADRVAPGSFEISVDVTLEEP